VERVQLLEMTLGKPVPWVFPHFKKGKRQGQRIQDFGKAWQTACRAAMLDGLEGEERERRKAD
jgi:hypothetical protein